MVLLWLLVWLMWFFIVFLVRMVPTAAMARLRLCELLDYWEYLNSPKVGRNFKIYWLQLEIHWRTSLYFRYCYSYSFLYIRFWDWNYLLLLVPKTKMMRLIWLMVLHHCLTLTVSWIHLYLCLLYWLEINGHLLCMTTTEAMDLESLFSSLFRS